MPDHPKGLNPWRRQKERAKDIAGYSHFSIRIERSHGRSAEITVYPDEEIDGLVVEGFRNYAQHESNDKPKDIPPNDPITMTEWRQLAKKLLILMKHTNKTYVYSDVMNKKFESLLLSRFGAEEVLLPENTKLVEFFGVQKFIRLSRDALEKIASAA